MSPSESTPTLIIVDGYSFLFRAHHALSRVETLSQDGQPTGALYGLASMLLRVLHERPDAAYIAWDAPGPTFRHEIFTEYKAHRPQVDPDLVSQFELAREMARTLGMAAVEQPGQEADDVIGALARIGREQSYEVIIYTGDSDLMQLVRPGVTVRMISRGVSDVLDYDAEAVLAKYGVRPDQIPELKAFVGDASDNIPGVPGIGKVTAARLLGLWESLDGVYAHVEDLPERTATDRKVKSALQEFEDQARLSLRLAQIRCDAPVEDSVRRYRPTAETWDAARALFGRLGFRSLMNHLPANDPANDPANRPSVPEPAREYGQAPAVVAKPSAPSAEDRSLAWTILATRDELDQALQEVRSAGYAAIRLHLGSGSALDARWLGLAFAADPSRAWYARVRARHEQGSLLDAAEPAGWAAEPEDLTGLLCGDDVRRIGYAIKPEWIAMHRAGLRPGSYEFDIALAAYLLQPGSADYGLPALMERYLGRATAPADDAVERLCHEAAAVAALREALSARCEADGVAPVLRQIEMPLVPVLAEMQMLGVRVDKAWLATLSATLAARMDEVAEAIYTLAGERFTIASPQQLQRVLFDKMQLPAGRKTKTGRTTSADHLETLAAEHPIARLILEYREASKLKSTYADSLPRLVRSDTGRVHTTLSQTVTATGRLASSDPNLQNIPVRSESGRQIRRAFIAPPGSVLLSCDYSQIELRVFAHVTGDAEMVRAFNADEDIHTATAMHVFGVDADAVTSEMRRRAKTVNFAVIYGQSAFGLSQTLGIPMDEARGFIAGYFRKFPGVEAWTKAVIEEARTRGYVETLLGRRRYLPDLRSSNRSVREGAERAAVNMPIQGTAADIMKLAMLAVQKDIHERRRPWVLALQVHDELLLEVADGHLSDAVSQVTSRMSGAYRLKIPLNVDAKAGNNWADLERVYPVER